MINDDYFIFTFCAFFPLFISNTSIVSINFGANLDAQNAGKDISGIQISKTSPLPFMRGILVTHVAFSHCYPPSNILSHRKVPFQKMPPHGKILKKGPAKFSSHSKNTSDLLTCFDIILETEHA